MDDSESQKLDRIHSDVRETRTHVRVIDERTKSMSDRMDKIRKDVDENADDIDQLESGVKRNTTILGGVATAATAAVLWVADKLRILL